MKKHTVKSSGKSLYVEAYGQPNHPAVLYIHGGPGSGGYDFAYYQAESLSEKLYVIVLDQRGVLRSEALADDEALTVDDIIDDFEAVRTYLSIEKWSIIGHSFGAFLSVSYVQKYPNSIEKMILVCPGIDMQDATKSVLQHMIALTNDVHKKQKITTILEEKMSFENRFTFIGEALQLLDDEGRHLYVYGEDTLFFERLIKTSPFPLEQWQKGAHFQQKLLQQASIFTTDLLTTYKQPHRVLLIRGKYDPVASDWQCKRIVDMLNAETQFFEKSGHFPYVEEVFLFSQRVQQFIQK